MTADVCDDRGEANVGCDGFYLMEAMILMYWRALCAASLWALLQEMPVPWHTVTGEVDSSARHWYWPFTVSSSVGESNAHQNMTWAAKKFFKNSAFPECPFHWANYASSSLEINLCGGEYCLWKLCNSHPGSCNRNKLSSSKWSMCLGKVPSVGTHVYGTFSFIYALPILVRK